jgi:putative transposase
MCEVIKVSKSGFYYWMKRQRSPVTARERYLYVRILEAFEQSRRTYGSRRIYRKLRLWDVMCYKNQVAKIMRMNGLKPKTKRKYKHTTDSRHSKNIAPNLLQRNFHVDEANKVYVGDITYIWTREGWLYLSTVMDLYSRRIIGWSLSNRITKELVIDSLREALNKRKPAPGLIFHSDRGSQYASDEFVDFLESKKAIPSMSRKGDCWDNAVAESFFKTIKSEMIYWYNFRTRAEAELRIFEYIEIFYNRNRLHSTNDYMSPVDFEMKNVS